MQQEINSRFDLSHGINYVKRSQDFFELFSFASSNDHIYDAKKSQLNRFIYYFKEQAKDLIEGAEQDRIIVPIHSPPRSIDNPDVNEIQFSKLTQVSRYYLSGPYQGIYLTNREVECLNWSVMGKTMEEISIILYISKKTVERHIDNIKRKLHLEKQSQLISFAIDEELIFDQCESGI